VQYEATVPDVIDRVVQEAVRQVLEPLWEPTFHPSNHGFRPGRSCHTAIAEAIGHLEDGYEWCVDLDLEKFLMPSSHCLPVAGGRVEQGAFGLWDQYS
jgi:retron-type reverse transcriptase